MRLLFLPLALLFLVVHTVQAQIEVGLKFSRNLYVAYEPIVATVTIRNLSGRDLPLVDSPPQQWFGFEILADNGRPIGPLLPDYSQEPLIIPSGETVERKVVLNTLYPVNDYGAYRVKATVYFSAIDKYFQSYPRKIEITEGRAIYQQTVGVPDGYEGAGGERKLTVMTFRRPQADYLYVRVEDPDAGIVYCTRSLGKIINGPEPEIRLDRDNRLNIIHLTGAKAYLYNLIGLNGEVLNLEYYLAAPSRPTFREREGLLRVVGGAIQTASTKTNEVGVPGASNIPKLSDRPFNIPKN